ncbi:calcium-binding protein [Methylopila sp. 73B]|uniref:calcium-binding protein n=1 Tax=Methylopila sp. 73B TaxID=1120792 RepID=UPI0003680204|nr:calcium-binding protein [Methylopila sp. 73B]
MITINAKSAVFDATGIDFEAYVRGQFVADTTGSGFPVFDNSSAFTGEEMFIGYGTEATSKYVLAHGQVEYAFGTHTVAGTINTIEYGTIGDGSYDADGYFTGGNVALTITGLDLSNPVPADNAEAVGIEATGPVHNFALAHMYGASGDQARFDTYADALDSEAQTFLGSRGNDVYVGTAFNDVIRSNAGDDRVTGGGGDDKIYGSRGVDTAVYSGNRADYAITRDLAGVVHVVDLRTGATSEGADQLVDVEQLEFADGALDASTIAAGGMLTLDASGASTGVDMTTFLADFFAGVATGAAYKFYGGTPDQAFGGTYYMNGDQLAYQYTVGGVATDARLVFGGEELAYDFIHHGSQYGHGITGALDSLTFGAWTADTTGTEGVGSAGLIQNLYEALKITGLGLDVAPGAGSSNPVHLLHAAARAGDASTFEDLIASRAQHFIGGDGDDVYVGSAFADLVEGGAGADTLDGGLGADTLSGGLGDDTYYVDNARDTVIEAAGEGADTIVASADFKLGTRVAVETLIAADGSDADLTANRYVRNLIGSDGDNRLDAFAGAKTVTGGAGEDTFVFTVDVRKSAAVISDFTSGEDSIELSSKVFTALGVGALAAGSFVLGSIALDADDHILYDSSTGSLFYDADGVGGSAALLFATLTSSPSLSAADFLVA